MTPRPVIRRRAGANPSAFPASAPAATDARQAIDGPRNTAPSLARMGGQPETSTSSSVAGQPYDSPGVNSGRAVSCRETITR